MPPIENPQIDTSFHCKASTRNTISRARDSIVISSSLAGVENVESPIPLYAVFVNKSGKEHEQILPVVENQHYSGAVRNDMRHISSERSPGRPWARLVASRSQSPLRELIPPMRTMG